MWKREKLFENGGLNKNFVKALESLNPPSGAPRYFIRAHFAVSPYENTNAVFFLNIYYLLMYRGIIKKLRKAIKPLNVKIL